MRCVRTASVMMALGLGVGVGGQALAQLRVGQWNVTNYDSVVPSSRDAAFKTALYGIAPNGLQFAPDVLIIQEVIESRSGSTAQQAGNASVASFLAVLNTAPGSPGDWASAPYIVNGGDTGNAFFYRTSRVTLLGTTALTANTGGADTQAPRDTGRWQIRMFGYTSVPAQLYLYGAHFKAGSTATDQSRREPEGQRIREDANALPDNAPFLLGADMNVQSSGQVFYQYMVGASGSPAFTADLSGRFFDPINTPGGTTGSTDWENNPAYRFIHTQDPAVSMDSRHDQILISGNLRDGNGMDYMPLISGGNILAPWNLSTWNDPNHSFRCWGNDGSSYNLPLTTTGNAQVGATIAAALVQSADGLGHLPVYLDLQVPAKLSAPSSINFGSVATNSTAQLMVQIGNGGDVARFSKDGTGRGIDALDYTLSASAGFTVAAGPFTDPAGGVTNSHVLTMNTSTPGPKSGTLTIVSNAPDTPSLVINVTGLVVGGAPDYDVNNDGLTNVDDVYAWNAGNTDVDGNGTTNQADGVALVAFLRAGEVADMTAGLR